MNIENEYLDDQLDTLKKYWDSYTFQEREVIIQEIKKEI